MKKVVCILIVAVLLMTVGCSSTKVFETVATSETEVIETEVDTRDEVVNGEGVWSQFIPSESINNTYCSIDNKTMANFIKQLETKNEVTVEITTDSNFYKEFTEVSSKFVEILDSYDTMIIDFEAHEYECYIQYNIKLNIGGICRDDILKIQSFYKDIDTLDEISSKSTISYSDKFTISNAKYYSYINGIPVKQYGSPEHIFTTYCNGQRPTPISYFRDGLYREGICRYYVTSFPEYYIDLTFSGDGLDLYLSDYNYVFPEEWLEN